MLLAAAEAAVDELAAAVAAATAAATPRSPKSFSSRARSFSKVMMDGEGPGDRVG